MLREVNCQHDPWTLARSLLVSGRQGVFLDAAAAPVGRMGWGGCSILAVDPLCLVEGRDWRDIERMLQARACPPAEPLSGGAGPLAPDGALLGTVDYDGRFCFGLFEDLLVFDHRCRQWLASGRAEGWMEDVDLVSREEEVSRGVVFREETGQSAFERMVRRAQEYIAAGDIYQVNLSRRFVVQRGAGAADMLAIHGRLRRVSPSPHAAFLRLGDREVVSSSPELFLKMVGRSIRTRPIKGTRPRGANPRSDAALRAELEASPKERAELVMITDLERNDLGQVCEFGSVRVTRLLEVETFEQVHHMVSTIEGKLCDGTSHARALAACLPGGSISGAPKIRACQIIEELEPVPRGLYTGVLGYLGLNGVSQLSIVIRTLVREHGQLHFHAGAGIVADSDPSAEFEETQAKASGLLHATRAVCLPCHYD